MDVESQLNLDADRPEVDALVADRESRLEIDSTPGLYWLVTAPPCAPTDMYYIRICWTRYPFAPPSVKFADAVGGSLSVTRAWPTIPGYRPSSFDICKPFTEEAFRIHPEWSRGPEAWRCTGNPFLWIVNVILDDFANHYGGRSA